MAEAASKKCDPIKCKRQCHDGECRVTGDGVAVSTVCVCIVQDVKTYLILTLYLSTGASPECWVLGLCTLLLAAPSL